MASKYSRTVKIIVYKKHIIKVKKDGECYIWNPNGTLFTWGEHLKHAKWSVNVSIDFDKKHNKKTA